MRPGFRGSWNTANEIAGSQRIRWLSASSWGCVCSIRLKSKDPLEDPILVSGTYHHTTTTMTTARAIPFRLHERRLLHQPVLRPDDGLDRYPTLILAGRLPQDGGGRDAAGQAVPHAHHMGRRVPEGHQHYLGAAALRYVVSKALVKGESW